MAIKIPNWVSQTWKYFVTGIGAAAATFLAFNTPDDISDYRQIVVGQDSVMVVVDGDTTVRATTEDDWRQKLRPADLYDNGYRLHVWQYYTINTLTGEKEPQIILTMAPPIGTQVNFTARAGRSELAEEKIPEKLETLPIEKAAEIGWYPVTDTMETAVKDSTYLQKRWANDAEAVSVKIKYVEPIAELEAVER
jgi:hypothetical protein